MRKHRLLEPLAVVILSGITTSAHASYGEEWLTPQQLKQEEARARHSTSNYSCASHAARCRPVAASSHPTGGHAVRYAHKPAGDDPIATFAVTGRATSRSR